MADTPAGSEPESTAHTGPRDDHAHPPDNGNLKRLGLALALAIAAAAIWASGFDVYKKGLIALRHGRLNINALMTVAVTGAFAIGQWPGAAMVMALYAIVGPIKAKAADRARNAIEGLLKMAPEVAGVRQSDATWLDTPVGSVPLQAVVRGRPGDRVPMDGVVATGSSTINQALRHR